MYIYKTTNLLNGKIYIGLSTRSVDESIHYYGSGSLLKAAIDKYGKENFSKEILESNISDTDTLGERESYWIEHYNATERGIGYNIASGGEGGNLGYQHSDSAKEAISEFFTGRPRSEETKSKISEAHQGKTLTQEHKKKLSNAHRGKKLSKEHRLKMSESAKAVIRKRSTCPHCGKEGTVNLMTRYHFDNCKKR